jgi:hypothetical protein
MNTIQQAAEQMYPTNVTAQKMYVADVTHYQNYLSQQGDAALAQWVIDNRYPNSENDKVSDFEMYQYVLQALAIGRQQGDGLTKACKDLLLLHNIEMEGITKVSPDEWYEAFNKLSDIIYP